MWCVDFHALVVPFCFYCLVSVRNIQTSNAGQRSCRSIDAAVRLPNDRGTYMFSGRRYIEYDETSSVEKSTGPIARLGIDLNKVDAAVLGPGVQNQVVLTSGCLYYTYNTTQGDFRHQTGGGNLTDWGLECDMDAGFVLNNVITVIKGCGMWSFNTELGMFQRDDTTTLSALGVPCDLDSAVTWFEDDIVLFIKGHAMWKWHHDDVFGNDEVLGPLHTDELNICSWFLCGEATFPRPERDDRDQSCVACNGDPRLCPLRLDQVTLPGLHNAGAGFSHGFGMFNCWVKNHGKTIYEQLELGIRHLDIDPCYDRCGFLGTCHSYFCGGSICSMLKQTRRFLLDHPNDVVTVNFNHEILEPRKVFRELTRQLKTQLGPMLNSAFRDSRQNNWPTLRDSIQSNKRLFVIYAYIIQNEPYAPRYRRNLWIHTEHWLGSTWREIDLTPGCTGYYPEKARKQSTYKTRLVTTTRDMCYHRQHRELVEVSAVPTPAFGTCVSQIAQTCRPRLMESLKVCEAYRFRQGKSPNVLLVDYPEVNPQDVTSVHTAVYLQNVRNILFHRSQQCKISVDAAVMSVNKGLFFSGSKVVTYDFDKNMQVGIRSLPDDLHDIQAACWDPVESGLRVIKGCQTWLVDESSFHNLTQKQPLDHCNSQHSNGIVDAAVRWRGDILIFEGCSIVRLGSDQSAIHMGDWGLPCNVDAVMTSQDGASLYIFKNDIYWTYTGERQATMSGSIKSWNMDVVKCVNDDVDRN